MSENIQLAIFGLVSAIIGAVLTAFLQPVFETFFRRKALLKILLDVNSYATPEFIKKAIVENLFSSKELPLVNDEIFKRLTNSDSFVSITIHNDSKKSINGISIRTPTEGIFQRIVGKNADCQKGERFLIGSLQGGEDAKVLFWAFPNLTHINEKYILQNIIISADEYDKVSYRFQKKEYISTKYFMLRKSWFWVAYWLIIGFQVVYNFVPAIFKFSK